MNIPTVFVSLGVGSVMQIAYIGGRLVVIPKRG